MIVKINSYLDKKLGNHEDNQIENTNFKALRTIWDFISDYKLGIKGKIVTFSQKINFKEQQGGTAFSIRLKDNKRYTYHLDTIEILNKAKTHHKLCFLNINEDVECLCFTYHTKETGITTLVLKDLIINNEVKYVECIDPKYKFKSGDILVQILIELVKTNEAFSHIKRIELQDNSMKRCYGIGLQLKYLRTITDGEPYYAKFGFRPIIKTNNEIYEYNKLKFKENKKYVSNKIFDDLFLSVKKDYKNLYNFYKSTYRDYILNDEKIEYIEFIRKMINMNKEKKFPEDKKKLMCELVAKIMYPLFKLMGYKDYGLEDKWYLKINRK